MGLGRRLRTSRGALLFAVQADEIYAYDESSVICEQAVYSQVRLYYKEADHKSLHKGHSANPKPVWMSYSCRFCFTGPGELTFVLVGFIAEI